MKNLKQAQESIKQLEKEVVSLEIQQTELLRKKWALEDKIRAQQECISFLSTNVEAEGRSKSIWKKIALLLAAMWAFVFSFFSIDKK